METQIKKITEDQFDEMFTLVKNHIDDNASFDGYLWETFGSEHEYVMEMAKQNRVITVIECDNEECIDENIDEDSDERWEITRPIMFYVSGYHLVNRIGYFIADKPYDNEFECRIDW